MSYFNYHAIIKTKIIQGKLLSAQFVDRYKAISPALILYFKDGSKYPIREYKFNEYLSLIEKYMK